MNKFFSIRLFAVLFLIECTRIANAQEVGRQSLRLVQTISMPNVKGRIDHMEVDLESKRLFIAAVENGSMEVVDLGAGKWTRSELLKQMQAAGFRQVFIGIETPVTESLKEAQKGQNTRRDLIDSVKLELGVNRIVYDPARKYLYVGYGAKLAGFDYGRVGIIDARSNKLLGDMVVEAHPSQILLDNAAHRIVVAVWELGRIDVFDARDRQVVLTWTTGGQSGDMALDQTHHRLFVATRNAPQMMIVYDSESGQEVARLPADGRMNGVYYDGWHKRIYVTCGRGLPAGFIFVYEQKDADHYEFIGKVPTGPGAGTSFWVPQLNRFYVAVPAAEKQEAAVLVFEPQP